MDEGNLDEAERQGGCQPGGSGEAVWEEWPKSGEALERAGHVGKGGRGVGHSK